MYPYYNRVIIFSIFEWTFVDEKGREINEILNDAFFKTFF